MTVRSSHRTRRRSSAFQKHPLSRFKRSRARSGSFLERRRRSRSRSRSSLGRDQRRSRPRSRSRASSRKDKEGLRTHRDGSRSSAPENLSVRERSPSGLSLGQDSMSFDDSDVSQDTILEVQSQPTSDITSYQESTGTSKSTLDRQQLLVPSAVATGGDEEDASSPQKASVLSRSQRASASSRKRWIVLGSLVLLGAIIAILVFAVKSAHTENTIMLEDQQTRMKSLKKKHAEWSEQRLLPHLVFDDTFSHKTIDMVDELCPMNFWSTRSQEERRTLEEVEAIIHTGEKQLIAFDHQLQFEIANSLFKSDTTITMDEFLDNLEKMFQVLKTDFERWRNDNQPTGFCTYTIVKEVKESVLKLRKTSKKHDREKVSKLHNILMISTRVSDLKKDKPKAPAIFKSDPLALLAENAKHHDAFISLCTEFADKFPTATIPSIYKWGFEDEIIDLDRSDPKGGPYGGGYRDGKLKGVARVVQKFFYKYNHDATNIIDILRCSFVFSKVEHVYYAVYMAIEFFRSKHPANTPVNEFAWIKDRIHEPMPNGYIDVLLLVRLPGTDMWTEVQFHIRKNMDYKNKVFHKLYKTMRHLPNEKDITKAIVDTLPNKLDGEVKRSRTAEARKDSNVSFLAWDGCPPWALYVIVIGGTLVLVLLIGCCSSKCKNTPAAAPVAKPKDRPRRESGCRRSGRDGVAPVDPEEMV